jgi:hypothetical protein
MHMIVPTLVFQKGANGSPNGCPYLQAIRGQLAAGIAGGTSGEYLDTIFTHRELLLANPSAHMGCAEEFERLASCLEARPRWSWQSHQARADGEAARAYREERRALVDWSGGGWLR